MLRKIVLLVVMSLFCAGNVIAADADVCYTASSETGSLQRLTSSTVFECPRSGSHTLPELAKNGWEIIEVSSHMFTHGPLTQSQNRQIVWMVVIQKH